MYLDAESGPLRIDTPLRNLICLKIRLVSGSTRASYPRVLGDHPPTRGSLG